MTHRYTALSGALLLLLAAPSTSAATCTWNGSANPWATPSAWSCGAVPGPTDDAVVGSGTVTLAADAQVRDLTLIGGTIDGAGDLAVGRALVWEAGTMAGGGTTTVATSTTLRGAVAKNVGRRVVVRGATTWSNGTLQMRDGGVFINEGMFVDNAVGSHSIARAGTIATEPLVVNRGTWAVESGGTNTNVDFSNEGSITVAGAGFRVIDPGRFTVTSTGFLFGTALLDVASGAVVSVAGTTAPGAAAVVSLPVRGPFPMAPSHVLDVDLAGTAAADYDRLFVEDGTVTVDGRLRVRVGSEVVDGGSFPVISRTGSGTLTGCYSPDEIDVVEPDGVTAAPYTVTVTCTAGGVTLAVARMSTAGEGDPNGASATLDVTGANPFSGRTALALTAPASGRVTVVAFDAVGRRVAVLFEGVVEAGRVVPVAVEAGTLPAGLYVVRATGDGLALSRRLTLVR